MAAVVPSVEDIFNNMDYGAVLESDKLAKEWISEQKFGFFINGSMKHPDDRKTFQVFNPCTGANIATILVPTETDIKQSIVSAHNACELWKNKTRGPFLYRIARNIQKHQQVLNLLECLQTGRPMSEVKNFDVPQIVRLFYYYAGLADLLQTESQTEEAHGVTVVIPFWNFPALHIAKMIAPALAAGNTVIVNVPASTNEEEKCSTTPLSAYFLADIIRMSGLPDGVFNLLCGTDEKITEMLITDDIVKKISFVGPRESGIKLRCLTAGMNKDTSLELNGKSTFIVFDGVDQDSVVEEIINAAFFNNGQSDFAASRLLIQETIFNDAISKLKIRMNKLRVGNGMDKTNDLGAVINFKHWGRRELSLYVELVKTYGAKVFQPSIPIREGNYFPPTLITNLDPSPELQIFGPILIGIPFRTVKESVAIANNSVFGTAAGVFTENSALALEVASNLKVGTVWINCYNVFDAAAPFGGCKQSGYGRHGGKQGLHEYLRPKKIGRTEVPIVSEIAQNLIPKIDSTYKLYIGGIQTRPDGNSSFKIFNSKKELLALIPEGSRKDIRNAVEAAQKAQTSWAKRTAHNRAQILYYLVENLEDRRDYFTGNNSFGVTEFEFAIKQVFHWAACCDKFGGSVNQTISSFTTIQVNEPIGVIGISCPDNWPLLSFVTLVAMAIAFGNTVVVIPNKTCPIPALDLIKVFDTSDIPGGVINIVSGDQDILAETLAQHHDINALWYFGNSNGCKKMEAASAENLKRIWIADENSIDWLEVIKQNSYVYNAVNCKTIWLPSGESYAN